MIERIERLKYNIQNIMGVLELEDTARIVQLSDINSEIKHSLLIIIQQQLQAKQVDEALLIHSELDIDMDDFDH